MSHFEFCYALILYIIKFFLLFIQRTLYQKILLLEILLNINNYIIIIFQTIIY